MMLLPLIKQTISEDVGRKQMFISAIQKIINNTLDKVRNDSEDWGLGEMDELDEIESIDSIIVNDIIEKNGGFRITVTLHKNSQRHDFDNVMATINYDVSKILGKSFVVIDEVVDNRTSGPGIDW